MHMYEKDGMEYPSVTTILSMIDLNEDLLQWANAMGLARKKISVIQEKALTFGTLAHSHFQSIVDTNFKNPLTPANPFDEYDLVRTLSNFNAILKTIEYHTIFTEHTIVSTEDKFAGTLDWYTEVEDKKCLIDFKTSKKPYGNYLLQLGGYAHLLTTEGYSYPDKAAILIANKNISSIHWVDKDELKRYTETFLKLKDFYLDYQKLPFEYGTF